MDADQLVLDRWAQIAQQAMLGYSGCFKPFFAEPDRLPRDTEFTLGQLHLRATSTSETALFITSHLKLWDAEILLRSVLEATLKFVFICVGEGDERERRVDEFLHVLPEIARLRRHRRAKELLARVPDRDAPQWLPLRELLMPDAELARHAARFPRDAKSRLEGKWGFTQIAESLDKTGGRFQDLVGLLFSYGMASHSVHSDGDAILIMCDRERRGEEREKSLEFAHAARMISDTMTYSLIRALAAYLLRGWDTRPILEVRRQFEPFQADLYLASEHWRAVEYGPRTTAGSVSDAAGPAA